jgi:hypothetical protein
VTDRLVNAGTAVALIGIVVFIAVMFISPPVSQVFSEHEDLIGGTPEPPAFDLRAVQAHFAAECAWPTYDADPFCKEVDVDGMTGAGDTLYVPTSLNGEAYDRAMAICDLVALAHEDEAGRDLGYTVIVVQKQNGGSHFPGGFESRCEQ